MAGDDGGSHTCPDHETACVWAFGQTEGCSEMLLLEHDRHDHPTNVFLCIGGRWEKLPGSVARFLRQQLDGAEASTSAMAEKPSPT